MRMEKGQAGAGTITLSQNDSKNYQLEYRGLNDISKRWSSETFKFIEYKCGGYVGVDEDTKHRKHVMGSNLCGEEHEDNPEIHRVAQRRLGFRSHSRRVSAYSRLSRRKSHNSLEREVKGRSWHLESRII